MLSAIRERSTAIAEKEAKIDMEGEVVEALRNGMYRIKVELSPYDLDRGRIVYRYR